LSVSSSLPKSSAVKFDPKAKRLIPRSSKEFLPFAAFSTRLCCLAANPVLRSLVSRLPLPGSSQFQTSRILPIVPVYSSQIHFAKKIQTCPPVASVPFPSTSQIIGPSIPLSSRARSTKARAGSTKWVPQTLASRFIPSLSSKKHPDLRVVLPCAIPIRSPSGCASCPSRQRRPGGCTWQQTNQRTTWSRRAPSRLAWCRSA